MSSALTGCRSWWLLMRADGLEQEYQGILRSVRQHANDKLSDDATLLLISVQEQAHAGASRAV